MSQTSGVLMIGPSASKRADFGAEIVPDFAAARTYLKLRKPSLLVFGQSRLSEMEDFCRFAMEQAPQTLWIVDAEGISPSTLIEWNNFGKLYDLIDGFDDPTLESKLQSALEAAGEQLQKKKLAEMFADQTYQLKRLSTELEARVLKRHKTLRKSLRTLEETKVRLESFHKALLGIHRASSISQMEQTLSEALKDSVRLEWVRVRFENQSSLGRQPGNHVLTIELPFANEKSRGEVMFAKAEGETFSDAESDFLHELSEGLALALSRLYKLEQAEILKGQWQATFDSIPHALCLTDSNFEILKLNRAFQQLCSDHTFRSLIGKNCFHLFFGKDFHPPHNMESPFSFRNARTGAQETEHFEVIGESLGMTVDYSPVQLILLRSITDEVRFERRILEASKLAELGTIGSSIAHELNNPLGGMLSFLQLILMDIKPTDVLFEEIKAMENAVLRCRDIVLNLLSFARKQDLGEFSRMDLWKSIDRAVKLIELQSKSKGVAIEVEPKSQAWVHASPNALAQVLNNILQNALDAIAEKIKLDPLFPGKINIRCELQKDQYQIHISDNGMGIAPENQTQIFNPLFTTRDPGVNRGMGLTTAFTIINEHRGNLEILSQTGSGTTAIITLPALL